MTLCKFYAQGYCKFGNECRFEHYQPHYNDRSRYQYQAPSVRHHQPRPDNGSSSSSAASGFSFTKALQQIGNRPAAIQQPQPSSSNSIFARTITSSSSIFGGGGGSAAPPKFSFSQAFQKIQSQPIKTDPIFEASMELEPVMSATSGSIFSHTKQPLGFEKVEPQKPQPIRRSFFDPPIPVTTKPEPVFQTAKIDKNNGDDKQIKSESEMYTLLERLSTEDVQKYRSERFIPPIPFDPPPFELCF